MATLREQLAAPLVAAFSTDLFGQVVSYQSKNINAIFRLTGDPQAVRQGSSATAELQVKKADVASWSVNDQVVIDGLTWSVKKEGQGSNWFKHVLHLERDRRIKP